MAGVSSHVSDFCGIRSAVVDGIPGHQEKKFFYMDLCGHVDLECINYMVDY